jgi:hypothetical protein
MVDSVPVKNNKNKKIIITIVVLVILLLSIFTALQMSPFQGSINSGISTNDVMFQSGSSGMTNVPTSVSVGAPKSMGVISPMPGEQLAPTDVATNDTTDKQIVKNGSLDLQVGSADAAAQKITQIAKANGGDVFASNFFESGKNLKSGTITLKVPFANFDKTFNDLKGVATLVVRESTSGQDVTLQYTDLQAQLKNAQAEEQQYLDILKQTQKVSDILDVTQQLSQVRTQIDQLQGQINYMDSQTKLASITVSLTEDTNIAITDSWRPLQVAKDAVNQLLRGAQGFVNSAIVFIIVIIPVAIFYAIFFWIIYWVGKKIYLKIKDWRAHA